MYVALTYVDVGNTIYSPGEIIEDDPNAEWHLKVKAIRPMAEKPAPKQSEIVPEKAEMPDEEAAEEINLPAEEAKEEGFEEPDAPEIDVTAALVKEPEKPKSRTKKGGKGK